MSNITFSILIGLSAGLLLLFFYAAYLNIRKRQSKEVELGELIPSFLPVDLEILQKLIDPQQQRHLQETYGHEELLRIYGQQVKLTIECLRRMTHNAALLQQIGYCQLRSGNQLIASLAQEMIDAGVHVRLYAFMGLIILQVRYSLRWIPLFSAAKCTDVQQLVSSSLLPAYTLLKDKTDNLACLKFSSLQDAVAESL
ncbi:MAG TPA: hypothetical protein VFB79_03390 [Candidatus Angelobacter sp.]|nr:hypothetical protein [Candidatus Angelobacter sp.]